MGTGSARGQQHQHHPLARPRPRPRPSTTLQAARMLTLLMTARCVRPARMWNQMPMSWARSATGRRYSHTNLRASRRISTQLLSRAKSGASGQAATKMVTNPNCSTAGPE